MPEANRSSADIEKTLTSRLRSFTGKFHWDAGRMGHFSRQKRRFSVKLYEPTR